MSQDRHYWKYFNLTHGYRLMRGCSKFPVLKGLMCDACHEVYGPPKKSSSHIAFVWGTNISEFLDPPSNSAKAKAWPRARARVETRPRANARARVRDRIRARAIELGLEWGNNFRGVQIKCDMP